MAFSNLPPVPDRRRHHRLRLGAVVAVAGLVANGCSLDGVAWREGGFEVVEPGSGDVSLPIRLAWTDPGTAGSYAVFIDRAPVPVGARPASIADGDDECALTAGCPDEAYLEARGVHVTEVPTLVLDAIRDGRSPERPQDPDRHEATIVILDADGRRADESYATVRFDVDRSRPLPSGSP